MALGLFFIGEWEGQLRGQHRFLSVGQRGAPPLRALGEPFVMVSPQDNPEGLCYNPDSQTGKLRLQLAR